MRFYKICYFSSIQCMVKKNRARRSESSRETGRAGPRCACAADLFPPTRRDNHRYFQLESDLDIVFDINNYLLHSISSIHKLYTL